MGGAVHGVGEGRKNTPSEDQGMDQLIFLMHQKSR